MKELKYNLRAFNLGRLQEFKNVAKILIKLNISLEQYIEFVEAERDNIIILDPVLKKCPNCLHTLSIFPVNISKTTQTGDNSKSVWICSKCHYEQFNLKSIREIIKE